VVSAIGTIASDTMQLPSKNSGPGDGFLFEGIPTCGGGLEGPLFGECQDTSA
jgi:hypothetical protein